MQIHFILADTSLPSLTDTDGTIENVPKTAVETTSTPTPNFSGHPNLFTLQILTNSPTDNITKRTCDISDSESVKHSQDLRTDSEQRTVNAITTPDKLSGTNRIFDNNERNLTDEIIFEKSNPPVEVDDSVTNTDTNTELNLEHSTKKEHDKSDRIPPSPLNILSRPKRRNAAAR